MTTQRHLKPVEDRPQRVVRIIDPATGDFEEFEDGCPQCRQSEDTLMALTHKYHAALAEITRMKKDPQAEAEKHKLWAEANCVHEWWRLATWHPDTEFGHEEFFQVLPRLKERGPVELLKAVSGAAFEPGKKTYRNGQVETFDSWELICRSKGKCDSFAKRAYPSPEGDKWKIWLVQRIESRFETDG